MPSIRRFMSTNLGVPKVSTFAVQSEQEFPSRSDTRPAFHVSLPAILMFVAFVLLIAAFAVFLYWQQQPWVEIVGKDLLRTNAPTATIASARDAVISNHQNWVIGDEGKRSDASYQGGGRAWSIGPSSEEVQLKITRGKTQITDKNAATLSIEEISVTDTPTLVFIDYSNPSGKEGIVNELVDELMKRGVTVR
jgi:hypothetical protein